MEVCSRWVMTLVFLLGSTVSRHSPPLLGKTTSCTPGSRAMRSTVLHPPVASSGSRAGTSGVTFAPSGTLQTTTSDELSNFRDWRRPWPLHSACSHPRLRSLRDASSVGLLPGAIWIPRKCGVVSKGPGSPLVHPFMPLALHAFNLSWDAVVNPAPQGSQARSLRAQPLVDCVSGVIHQV